MDNFLDLGRNLIPDNLFQAAFETVNICLTTINESYCNCIL